ncbi:ferric reductase [Scheffersomyces coipomensis]|uniref:ferric reductase n=1 Tax=Scheffersomyces coipomensis TaxID=1788519 RepID=UPI00315D18B7
MVSFKSALFVIACLTSISSASDDFEIFHESTFPNLACTALIGKMATFFTKGGSYCDVKLQQALGTYTHCLETIPDPNARKNFLISCAAYNLTEEQYLDSYNNATKYLLNTTADPTFNATKISYLPVLLPKKRVIGAWKSERGRYYNYNYAFYYGVTLFSYWYLILFMAGICNLAYFVCPNFIKQKLTGPAANKFRQLFTLPALGSKSHAHHTVAFKFFVYFVPTRLESVLVGIWIILAIVFNCISFTHDSPNIIWPQKPTEMGRKIADRSGQICLWLLPNLILFSGRNNVMQWISGWNYSRFILIHKWNARMATLMGILHAIGMTYNGKGLGKYEMRNKQPYVRWGYVSLIAMCLLSFHSMLVFRKSRYELFILIHIILAIFFIAGGWIHTSNDGFQQWYYAATAIWGFDRLVRLIRLFSFGVRTAEVQLIANETLRVKVPRPAHWKPFPGCHAFIHFLRPTCFWQSHPFTIVDSVVEDNTINFYIKVKGGITHGLYQYLSKQPNNKALIKVSIEGPYGQKISINKYENTVFIAGGNGIPGLYYEATDIAKTIGDKTRIKLYWVIRHYRSIEWFYPELLRLKNTNIEPIIYITQPHVGLVEPIFSHGNESEEEEEEEQQEKKSDTVEESTDYIGKLKNKLNFIEFREGKPDFYTIVGEEIKETNGPIAFASCAHGSMVDDTRKGVVDHINNTKYRVELFEQQQTW